MADGEGGAPPLVLIVAEGAGYCDPVTGLCVAPDDEPAADAPATDTAPPPTLLSRTPADGLLSGQGGQAGSRAAERSASHAGRRTAERSTSRARLTGG